MEETKHKKRKQPSVPAEQEQATPGQAISGQVEERKLPSAPVRTPRSAEGNLRAAESGAAPAAAQALKPEAQRMQAPAGEGRDKAAPAPGEVRMPKPADSPGDRPAPEGPAPVQLRTPNAAPGRMPERAEPAEDFQTLIRGRYREAYLRSLTGVLGAQLQETRRYQDFCRLRREADELRRRDPDFDLHRALEDPTLVRLLENGIDLDTAWAVLHREDRSRQAERQREVRARPVENGLGRGSVAAVLRPDPRSLTPQQRRQLRRRAARGEEIVW